MPEDNEPSEVELLRQIAFGDQKAFAQFYDRFSGILFSVALKIIREPKEAEDVLQEVFLQIWAKAADFNPKLGRPLSWVVTLTRNKAIDRLRASQRRFVLAEDMIAVVENLSPTQSTSSEDCQAGERATLIRTALAELPAEQRQAIELAFFRGLTQSDISQVLQQPLGTVKARIRRGLLKLREALEKIL